VPSEYPGRDAFARGGFCASAALCAVVGLLSSWGSPSWLPGVPLRYAYRFMDALGAYALSCLAYFAMVFFPALRGKAPSRGARALLFVLCFMPVIAHSAMVLADRGFGRIDLYRRLDAFLCWGAAACAALPCALRRGGSSMTQAPARQESLAALGALSAWLITALSGLVSLIADVPLIVPASLIAILFVCLSVAALASPPEAGKAPSGGGVFPEQGGEIERDASAFEAWGISAREREVIELVVEGKTNSEIAESLFISLSTVKTHLASVFGKTGARNRVEVARLFPRLYPPKG
jgi:DNA-binding CsgD family transcriptional regulator